MTKLSNTEFKDPNEGVLVTLALNEIKVDETMNLRQVGWENDKTITTLAEDINEKGQLQPVLVMPISDAQNGDARYSLVAGFRRYRAIAMANNEWGQDLSVLARVVNVDNHGAMLDNLAENIQRKNLSPIDVAHAAMKLQEAGLSVKEIAKQFGNSDTWLRQTRKLLTLPEHLQRDIHTGKLDFGIARVLIGLDEKQQEQVLATVARALEIGEGGQQAAVGERDKIRGGKRQAGGRKKKADSPAAKKGLSAKAAVLILEETVAEVKAQEKILKADARSVEVYDLVVKFLHGKFGAQSFHKKMVELLG